MKLFVQEDGQAYRLADPQEILQASRHIAAEGLAKGNKITNTEEAIVYIEAQLQGKQQEEFWCLYLDNKHRIIAWEVAAKGSIRECQMYPRELVKRALELNSCALILAHNHPSGGITVSESDKVLTKNLQDIFNILDIMILDHIIIGKEPVSFLKLGLL